MSEYENLYRITAFCPKNQFRVELRFRSEEAARKANPQLEDFQVLGIVRVKKSYY